MPGTAKITFLPVNQTIEVAVGETILDVAIANDIPLQHACGGFCACTTCQVEVRAGETNLAPIDDLEEERLESVPGVTLKSRLGCQAKILGDVTVEIVNLE